MRKYILWKASAEANVLMEVSAFVEGNASAEAKVVVTLVTLQRRKVTKSEEGCPVVWNYINRTNSFMEILSLV